MYGKRNNLLIIIILLISLIWMSSCGGGYVPKPRGYFRIDFPEKEYIVLDTNLPYTFEYPVYTEILPDHLSPDQAYWINIDYPGYKGKVHLSYKVIDGNLVEYLEDSRTMVVKHIQKASSIEDQLIIRPEDNVYGLKYRISGIGAASPYQFFVTDSATHFLRGALYFNVVPNNDSLQPVIDFITEDIDHLINTLKWKENL